jgi:hypothetical protein
MRLVAVTIAAAALVLGACEGDSSDSGAGYAGYGDPHFDGCRQFASCGTCTPVNGCGWCFDSDGTGMCAASPDECATPVFSWTWNPDGCRVPADAGTAQSPALGTVSTPGGNDGTLVVQDASEPDAGSDGAVVVDAALVTADASAADVGTSTQVEVP